MVFIFTCSVREKPEQKVHSAIGRVRRANPGAGIAVAGCVAQQLGDEFLKYPQVRLILGSDGIVHAPVAAERLLADPALRLSFLDFTGDYPDRAHFLPQSGPSPAAFVNIMQGCDNFCAYCIVPYTRGRAKSRPLDAVLEECRAWLEGGACDITLLGQNVNAYEAEGGFYRLLKEVAVLPGLQRLHFVSAHPRDMSPQVIEAFAQLPMLAPRLHLPLQSGSDTVLERMGRGYTRAKFLDICAALRQARPDLALSTDLIVGFPGETEAEFEDSLACMREAAFMSSFSFCYSDRPGTRASTMPFKVPSDVQAQRLNRLQALQEELSAAWLQSRLGQECELLMEGAGRDPGQWQGRSPWGDTVNVRLAQKPCPGSLVRVRISECRKHSLIAVPL